MQNHFVYLRIYFIAIFFVFTANNTVYSQTQYIDSLLIELNKKQSDTAKIPILLKLSTAFTMVDPDKKFYYANHIRLIAEKYQIDSLIPRAYIDMGMKYGIKTEYDSAMFYFTKALKVAQEKKIDSQLARAYVNIGYTFDRLENTKAAVENYKRALKIFKKIKHKRGINQTYVNLGGLYYDLREYKIADDYFRQMLEICKKNNDEAGIAQGYFNLGGTSFKLGKFNESYDYYIKSLKIREKMEDLNGIALANWGLGELYTKQRKYVEAKKALNIALQNNRIIKNKYQEAVVLMSLSRNELSQNNYDEAQKIAEKALDKNAEIHSKTGKMMSFNLLVDINKASKNYKKAFEYQSQSILVRDSLNIEQSKKDLIYSDFQRMRTENNSLEKNNEVISNKNLSYKKAIYIITSLLVIVLILLFMYLNKVRQKNKINLILEDQKKEIKVINQALENSNEELRAQNELISYQKEELERINTVKNKFFSIVSHDLRSPIATLQMLFSTYYNGDLTQERMDQLLKELEASIFETADFLDNLLEWSKSQLEGMVVHPESVEINALISRNLQILNPQIVEKKLVVHNTIKENSMAFVDKNMMNVVFRNLLSNSVKFCNSGDSILLNSNQTEDNILISIQDTGIGMHPNQQKKIFQLEHSISQGTSEEKGHRIGLVLVKDMVEQNNGKIWFESTFGEGTTFFIELPIIKS